MAGVSTEWTRHLKTKEEKADFESSLRNNTHIFTRLQDILDGKIEGMENTEDNKSMYDAGYPYLQAHLNGRKAALKEMKKLIEFING